MNCAYFKMLVRALMFSVGLAGCVFAGTNSRAQASSVVVTNSANKATASDLKTRLEYQLSVGVETNGAPQVESVIMSQQIEGPLEQNQNVFTTVHQIETKAGLTFFPGLRSATRKTLDKEDAQFNLPPRPVEKHN